MPEGDRRRRTSRTGEFRMENSGWRIRGGELRRALRGRNHLNDGGVICGGETLGLAQEV